MLLRAASLSCTARSLVHVCRQPVHQGRGIGMDPNPVPARARRRTRCRASPRWTCRAASSCGWRCGRPRRPCSPSARRPARRASAARRRRVRAAFGALGAQYLYACICRQAGVPAMRSRGAAGGCQGLRATLCHACLFSGVAPEDAPVMSAWMTRAARRLGPAAARAARRARRACAPEAGRAGRGARARRAPGLPEPEQPQAPAQLR